LNQSIAHISLVIRDYDEAIKFYCGKLRFELIEDTYQPEQDKRWVVVAPNGWKEQGGTKLLLARASTPEQETFIGCQAGGRVLLFLRTDDFERDYQHMLADGIKFERPPRPWSTAPSLYSGTCIAHCGIWCSFAEGHPMA